MFLYYLEHVEETVDVSETRHNAISPIEQAAPLNQQPSIEASSKDVALTGQPVWEIGMVMEQQQASVSAAFPSIPIEEEDEDLERGRDGGEEEVMAVTMTASLADKMEKTVKDSVLSESLIRSVPVVAQPELLVPPPIHEQSELFDHQTLQTVVTGCDIPDQRATLEGSQVDLAEMLIHTKR